MQFVWEKPVITFYKERIGNPEKDAFAAVQARRLIISNKEEGSEFVCVLEDFFPIMGKLDYVYTNDGKADRYVLCWFDTKKDDFAEAFRRITGVTFSEGIKCVTDEKGKMTCNSNFEAKHGKLD